jgi:hypothetical protein
MTEEWWVDVKLLDGQSITDDAYTMGIRELAQSMGLVADYDSAIIDLDAAGARVAHVPLKKAG